MRTALLCKTAPSPFVKLDEVKAQLNIATGDSSKNDFLTQLLEATCGHLDGADGSLKRAVADQVWILVLPSFRSDRSRLSSGIEIPLPPLRSIESIKYIDQAGDEQLVDPAAYRLVYCGTERSRVVPVGVWPPTACQEDAVKIEFRAGYGTEDGQEKMPKQIRQAVMLIVKQLYDLGGRNTFLASEEVPGVYSRSYFAEGGTKIADAAVDRLLSNIRIRG